MALVADKYPEKYGEISKQISDIGRRASYLQGETVTLADLAPPIDRDKYLDQMDAEIELVNSTIKNKDQKLAAKLRIYSKYSDLIEKDVVRASKEQGTNLGKAVLSGARGNAFQLKAMVATPALYTDYKDDPIPLFIRRSFGEGLRPYEYLASAFGVRKSVLCLHQDTLVRMGDGSVKKLNEIKVGDYVLGSDKEGSTFPVEVLNIFYQGDQPVYRYTFTRGSNDVRDLICTANHKILTHKETDIDVYIKNYIEPVGSSSDEFYAVLPSGYTNENLRDVPDALQLGLLAGESCKDKASCNKDLISGWNNESVAKYIAGYITTGGDVIDSPSLSLTIRTSSNQMYDEVKELLEFRFGIYVTSLDNDTHSGVSDHRFSITNYTSLLKFKQIAKYLPETLRQKYYDIFSDVGLVPHIPYDKALKVDSEFIGDAPCMDLEVDHPDHLFVLANGIIVSNSTKNATADAGDVGKQLTQVTTPLMVTMDDCGTANGIDLDIDAELKGRVLAKEVEGIPIGTVIDNKIIKHLKSKGVDKVIARSALVCQADAGLCSKCIGTGPRNQFHPIGYAAGITASSSISEPLAQGSLNCLVEGTPVMMSDGTVKAIQDIKPGDIVLGSDLEGNTFPTKVTHVWDQGIQPTYEYTLIRDSDKKEDTVTCTEIHGFLTSDNVVTPIGDIVKTGISLKSPNGVDTEESLEDYFTITDVVSTGDKQCWDISVEHEDSLFVLGGTLPLICSNTKHSGGGFMGGGERVFSGFDILNQFIQSPRVFPHRASVAELDGRVDDIKPAPQGGTYIYIGDERHFVLPGYEPVVKVGDTVEAGERLSEGLIDPSDIVRLRGLGEGRRYYAENLKKILDDSDLRTSSRNAEIIARAAIDHIEIDDPDGLGGYLPGDMVSYNTIQTSYTPPDTAKMVPLDPRYSGKYLEQPVLHYSIGTKLTPSIIKRLQDAGHSNAFVSDDPPQFTPSMVRLRAGAHNMDDWLAKMDTSYLKGNLISDAHRGRDTNTKENIHYAPRIAVGVNFGEKVDDTGKF